jgi:membrane protease YdiL (CAAX protease family)
MVLFPQPEYGNNIKFDSPAEAVLVLVILGPLLETLIFQHYLLQGLRQWLHHALAAAIVVALLFGLVHWYSIPYIAKATISGLLYNLLYLTLQQRRQPAFWYTAATHACFNAIAFLHSLLAS